MANLNVSHTLVPAASFGAISPPSGSGFSQVINDFESKPQALSLKESPQAVVSTAGWEGAQSAASSPVTEWVKSLGGDNGSFSFSPYESKGPVDGLRVSVSPDFGSSLGLHWRDGTSSMGQLTPYIPGMAAPSLSAVLYDIERTEGGDLEFTVSFAQNVDEDEAPDPTIDGGGGEGISPVPLIAKQGRAQPAPGALADIGDGRYYDQAGDAWLDDGQGGFKPVPLAWRQVEGTDALENQRPEAVNLRAKMSGRATGQSETVAKTDNSQLSTEIARMEPILQELEKIRVESKIKNKAIADILDNAINYILSGLYYQTTDSAKVDYLQNMKTEHFQTGRRHILEMTIDPALKSDFYHLSAEFKELEEFIEKIIVTYRVFNNIEGQNTQTNL